MSREFNRKRTRIEIEAPPNRRTAFRKRSRQTDSPKIEALTALGIIAAAALATFLALFLTSRPFDPMDSSVNAQQDVPQSTTYLQPSPKATPSARPSVAPTIVTPGEPAAGANQIPDDAEIQAEIEKETADDPALDGIDVTYIVEGGKVTIGGAVASPDIRNRIERIVRSVRGVASINNQLVVRP